MPDEQESIERFHRAAREAHQKRKLTAFINKLWQDNHLTEGFIAEAMKKGLS